MEIIVGKTAGFCPGITRAVNGAEKLVNESSEEGKIYCIGELTHNKQVMQDLESKGLIVKEKISDVPDNAKALFRSHGMPKKSYEEAKEKGLELYDFTCLKLVKIHEQVEKATNDGKYIFLIGEKKHPEIIGTLGFAKDNISLIENESDINFAIDDLMKSRNKNLYIISQTTFSFKGFDNIVSKIKEKIGKIEKEKKINEDDEENYDYYDCNEINIDVNKSICEATEKRQLETEKIAKEVDYMVIIGGKHSSNTTKLYEISKKQCKNAIHVQTKDELIGIDFSKHENIGIMAGASTPKKSIDEVIEFLKAGSLD